MTLYSPDALANTAPLSPRAVVHIVDDDAAVRQSLRFLLDCDQWDALAHASAEDFLAEWDRTVPGCVVTDVRMPGMGGEGLVRHLAEQDWPIPVVVISGHADVKSAVTMMRSGALDLLQKPFEVDALIQRVTEAVARDRERHQARAAERIIHDRYASLSDREREVMGLVVAGLANKQIARELFISEKTVEVHRSRVMSKMGATSLPELVRLGLMCKAA